MIVHPLALPALTAQQMAWLVTSGYVAAVVVAFLIGSVLWTLHHDTHPPKQTTFAYCPGCLGDLCSNPKAVHYEIGDGSTEFRCTCGRWSKWDFDAPAPILLASSRVAFGFTGATFIKPEYVGRLNDKGKWVPRAEG